MTLLQSVPALRTAIMKEWILYAVITLGVFAPNYANADFLTVGTFEWFDAAGDQAESEALGNVSGLGTSSIEIGIPLGGSGRNLMEFTGTSGDGELPTDFFNIGSITAFNGDIIYDGPPFPFPLVLQVSGQQCDSDGLNCVEMASGQALLFNFLTINSEDPISSADSFCMEVLGGDFQCAQIFEQTTKSFDLTGQFGSLTIMDIIPTSPGAFVTLGFDPTMNVIRSVVTIDIKPGSDPNCFNLNGHGVIPVSILGNGTFDVSNVDQSSLSFGGLNVRVRGNKGPFCGSEDTNNDGFLDLVCHFQNDASNWEPGNGHATLTGMLLDGTDIEGTDSICVVP